MVRIIIKGGVWKNTEDEVLKAAIAKYGKNQWARISSLLVRKTPKQCKARWYEWLDPSIKKTEWSKEEDEKLLHLAKLMPTQWRTIAPIVGRTATQCLERYQKLLDEAEQKENEELGLAGPSETGPAADDVRRLRPGEIDPDPETKPARPDPIDMDEDEKEMLSEARARLANTQGKKAKRKARERQLEEARRLAVLQKKRELKAAGIIMRYKTKKKGMDYNADIPFEKKPAAGFYDTSEEQARITSAPVGQTLRRLENKRKPEEEEAERKKRQRRGKDGENVPHETKFVAAREAQIQKLKEADSIGRRSKLVLPTAQVGEKELEEIAKIGRAGENARALTDQEGPSGQLLGSYSELERAKVARTPRTAAQQDTVMMEARNLRNMTAVQTPLLGEENTPMHVSTNGGTGFEGATPQHQVAFTPNPLATPRGILAPGATPRIGATPGTKGEVPYRTPMNDSLNLNLAEGAALMDVTPRGRNRTSPAARFLRSAFTSLPKPENNFELLVPEEEEEEAVEGAVLSEEDAAERDARLKRRREEQERLALARRSQAVQKTLPRPSNVDIQRLLEDLSLAPATEEEQVQKMVDIELARLLQHDSLVHPLPGTSQAGGTPSSYEPPADQYVASAKDEIHRELSTALGFPDAPAEQVKDGLVSLAKTDVADDSTSWAHFRQNLAYDVSTRRWELKDTMAKEASRAVKVEKKLGVTLGGYVNRARELAKTFTGACDERQQAHVDLESFARLRANGTFLTEASFGVAHDKLVQVITDVQPFEPYWEDLSSIDLSGKHIESVARLKEFLPKLDSLALNCNQLSWLSGVPTTVRMLSIADNALTRVTSFNHLLGLENLDVSRNNIDSLKQLECLRHLRELRADGNRIRDLDGLQGMDGLVKLSMQGNCITHAVDFDGFAWIERVGGLGSLPSLIVLNLDAGFVMTDPAHHLLPVLCLLVRVLTPLLTRCHDADNNWITDLDAHGALGRLRILRLSANKLKALDVAPYPNLRTLYADNNFIAQVTHARTLSRLENLSLRNQGTKGLSLSIRDVRDVRRLYLSGVLQPDLPGDRSVPTERAAAADGRTGAEPARAEPELQLPGRRAALEGLRRLSKLTIIGSRLKGTKGLLRVLKGAPDMEMVDF
ncbi:hypothetical protein EWM64_g4778, partial [Hericium alpestre]